MLVALWVCHGWIKGNEVQLRLMGKSLVLQLFGHKPKYWTKVKIWPDDEVHPEEDRNFKQSLRHFIKSSCRGSPTSVSFILRGSYLTAQVNTKSNKKKLTDNIKPSKVEVRPTNITSQFFWFLIITFFSLCSTAPTGCSAVNYIMLVLRVAELVLITVIIILLFKAWGENTNICLGWWTQSVTLQLKSSSVLYFPGNQRPPDDNTVSRK